MFSFLQNNTLSRAELDSDGEVLNIHYGDVLIKFGSILDCNDKDIPHIASGHESQNYQYLQNGDIIIADTAEDETVGKATELVNVSGRKVEAGLHTIPCRPLSCFASMYLGYYMNTPHFHRQLIPLMQGIKVLSISKGNIAKTKICAPKSMLEQQKISYLLNVLDRRTAAQRKVIEVLKKYKRGVIQHIFRRSHGQTESQQWQQVRLGDIFKKVSRRNTDGKIKNVITNSAEYGLIPQRDFFDKDIAIEGNTENYYVIENGDFVYNPRKSITAPYGPFNRYTLKDQGIISPLYTCLVLKVNINPSYLAWYFKSDAWHRYIYDNGSQGVRHDRVSMTDDLLMGIPVIFPDRTTQDSIANALDLVENRLHLAQNKMDLLNMTRKGFMQQLFI